MPLLDLSVSSGASLDVRRFSVREAMSEPFEMTVVARCDDPSLDLDLIVGRDASFCMGVVRGEGDEGAMERRWTGICRFAEMEQSEPTGISTYRFVLVPALWKLGQTRRYRVFQHRSAPEIAADLLDGWGLERDIAVDLDAHVRQPFKVQYGETDLAFFCRILEEARISFAFPNGRLTLSDGFHAGLARSAPMAYAPSLGDADERDLLTDVRLSGEARAGERADRRVFSYRTNVLDLAPGHVFFVAGHPHPDLAEATRLLVVASAIDGAPDEVYHVCGHAVSAEHPYRPRPKTPRPRARMASATVIGPSGEDIHTDEFGRVCVRFPWESVSDGAAQSTCWIRVSHGWAGAGHGMMTLPRVGNEVLVDFLHGDPEQPVVVGRMFNAQNAVVERLPEHATKSVWRSGSTPGGGAFNEISFEDATGKEVFSERAEKDARRLVKHDDASTVVGNRRKHVANHEVETTERDRVQVTGRDRIEQTFSNGTVATLGARRDKVSKDSVERTEGDLRGHVGKERHVITRGEKRVRVEHEAHLEIGKDRPESVRGTDSLTVGASLEASVGSYTVNASGPEGTIHWVAGSEIVMDSGAAVTIKAGGDFVEVGGGKVVIVGSEVVINEGGAPGDLPGSAPTLPEPPRIAQVDEPEAPEVRGAVSPA